MRPATESSKEKPMSRWCLIPAAALVALAPGARAATSSKVTGLEASAGKVIIHTDARPEFTVFKLSAPPRVVIDLNGGDVSAAARPLEVHQGGIAGVSAAQFDQGATRVGRIVVALEGDQKYDVAPAGNDLVLTVGEASGLGSPASGDPNVVTAREDAIKTDHPAHKLAEVSVDGTDVSSVHIGTDGEVAKFRLVELKNPARLALDLHGISGKAGKVEGSGLVKDVRFAKHEDGMRIVVDAGGDSMPKYQIARRPDGLEVKVGEMKLAAAQPAPKAPAAPRVAPETGIAKLIPIHAIDMRAVEGRTEVLVALEQAVQFEIARPDATTSALLLHGAALPDRLERKLDASSLGGPVLTLSAYRVPDRPGEVKVMATVAKGTVDEMTAQKGTLIWKFSGPKAIAQSITPAPKAAAAMASETRSAAGPQNVYDASQYTGRKVDFNVKDIDIKNLLGAIAEISKKNIIVADDVKGTVTIKLRNVPWDQALDIVLKSKGLGREDIGNIIRVAPIQTLRQEAREAADASKNRLATEPLKVRLIPVNYAKASDLTSQIKDSLTERGTVAVDARTNTLIVKDVQEALMRAEGIVRNLDTQTPEVLIESRIVEAATSFARSAGIQWGGNVSFAPTFGNPTGLIFPNILSVAGAADDTLASTAGLTGVSTPNFAVNMPTAVGANTGGGLGFVFGTAGGSANLNLRLTAAENSGTIKTISSPRVVTVDNVDASISQGVSVPFSQTSAAGVSTVFIEARLELRVTPHVTQEGSIQMKINATNNQPNPQLTGANGQPSISRREAKTEVLVKDGETTVIGGIYTRRNSESWNEVPVLSKIPVLGWLFKKKSVSDDRTELLIFITPRIVNRSQSVVASAPSAGDEGKQ
ncbi:MAG: type IV pilus secretin PilQ [Deltaproteobacteria bacterium]|nr:MAG: type IV pilus secretin PilQ [Deltaproteobacteria bacterium]